MQFFSTIASLIACASAYKVLTPTANSTIAKGSTVNVQFSTVDTDASTFSVYLVNFITGHFPPTVLSLAQDISQNVGSVNVRIPCDVSSGPGYQLNFINGTNTYVIYAQSADFSLTGDCVDPSAPAAGTYTNSSSSSTSVSYQTIIYENPVVWFVQPANLVAAAAICPPASQQTVTVQVNAPTVTATATVTNTVTVASCPSQAVIVSALAHAQGLGAAAAAVAPAVSSGAATARAASASPAASSIKPAGMPAVSTLPVSQSGAAKTGGAMAAVVLAFAVLLF